MRIRVLGAGPRCALALLVLLSACSAEPGPSVVSTPAATSAATPSADATPSPTASPPRPAADLSVPGQIWIAPLPPMPTGEGRQFIGSEDFMDLWDPGAPWIAAEDRIGVFKLYGEWVAYHATPAQLRTVVEGIRSRGMVLAVEMGPLDPTPECGQGIEGFAGIDEGRLITRRIRDAGGTLQVIALDEPYYFAHVYNGPNACRWAVDDIAARVATFVASMREEWPDLLVGDTEPMPHPVAPDALAAWMDAYATAGGESFAFLHLDMDWSRSDWPQLAATVQAAGRDRGMSIGMIYNGGAATSDAQWLTIAGRRVLEFEAANAGESDHVLFQSWMDKPDRALPESEPTSFMALVNRYVEARATLGDHIGPQANVALDAHAIASGSSAESPPGGAVDGDADTLWSSADDAPGWIEIDLGSSVRVAEIRMSVSQFPAGPTTHRVSCRAETGSALVTLADVTGATADNDVLVVTTPGTPCRSIHVETRASPSWVAWREIEVVAVDH